MIQINHQSQKEVNVHMDTEKDKNHNWYIESTKDDLLVTSCWSVNPEVHLKQHQVCI